MKNENNGNYQSSRCKLCNADCRWEAEQRVGIDPKKGESMLSVWEDLVNREKFDGSYQSFYFHFRNLHHLKEEDRKVALIRDHIKTADDVAKIVADFKTVVPGLRLEALFEKEQLKNFTTDEIELLAFSNKTKMLNDIKILIETRDRLKELMEECEDDKNKISAARALKDVQKEITETRIKAIQELERIISTRRGSNLENPDTQPNSENNKFKQLFEQNPVKFMGILASLNKPDAVIIENKETIQ